MISRHALTIAGFAGAAFLVGIFLKIAWVTDDAYITFRSIEQLFAGNGPRWNPHERVQVFTSPLWFWYLSAFRVFSENVFLNAIVASALLFVPTLFIIRQILKDNLRWLVLMVVLVSSIGFFDYTTSGLENSLAYLLLATYLLFFYRLFDEEGIPEQRIRALTGLSIMFGLLLVVRHDLLTLILPPTWWAVWAHRRELSRRRWTLVLGAALTPLFLWSAFSLLYYGSIFPNTAYAKLMSGLDRLVLLKQGLAYLWIGLRYDTITVLVVTAACVALFLSKRVGLRALGAGILLNLAYVVYVGGDFMLGRFLSYAFLVGAIALARYEWRAPVQQRDFAIALAGVVLYMFFFPHTPVNSPVPYKNSPPHPMGIADERGSYVRGSLHRYLTVDGPIFPDHQWAVDGFAFSRMGEPVRLRLATGYFGYWAGTEKVIVDRLALSDPLLARLPADKRLVWRIGHFGRQIPDGYVESIESGENIITDPLIRDYYEKIRLVTEGDTLLASDRIVTIILMNLGAYNYYIRDYQ